MVQWGKLYENFMVKVGKRAKMMILKVVFALKSKKIKNLAG
jgi:hypothetical protein